MGYVDGAGFKYTCYKLDNGEGIWTNHWGEDWDSII